jgi:hypothetical protein
MKKLLKIFLIVALACVAPSAMAEENSSHSILSQVSALAAQYKGKKGVASIVIEGGSKLNMVKMILRKDFDKEFIEGIKRFAIISYKDATEVLRNEIVDDIAPIIAPLTEVDVKSQLKPNARGRGYARLTPNGERVSDLVIVMESPAPKLIYFGGDFAAK